MVLVGVFCALFCALSCALLCALPGVLGGASQLTRCASSVRPLSPGTLTGQVRSSLNVTVP